MELQLVIFCPLRKLVNAHAAVTQICQFIHKQTVSGRCGQRVDDADFSVGIFIKQFIINKAKINQFFYLSKKIIFRDYSEYQSFLDFVQVGGLTLGYMPLRSWRYLDCVVQLEKSEIKPNTNRLISPITFLAKSYWYESLQIYQTSGEIRETDKLYAFKYEYTYGDASSGSVEVYNGKLPSFFRVMMLGPLTNPSWRVFVGGNLYKEGKLNVTIPSGHKLVVDTYPATMEISEYTTDDVFVRDLYGESDFSTERIFQLPPGQSSIILTDESVTIPTGWVEVKKRV